MPCATLIPHVYPPGEPDFPVYSLGARLPRTAVGRALWRRAQGPVAKGLERGRVELNDTRARLGLEPLDTCTAASAASWRSWPRSRSSSTRAPGRRTSTWSARSCGSRRRRTSSSRRARRRSCSSRPPRPRTPSSACSRAALRGLADLPVRVLATWNRRLPPRPLPVPENAQRRRLGLLLAHHAPLRRRRLPRRPRHARPRAGLAAVPSSHAPPSAT